MSDTQIEITPQELKTLPQDSYQLIDTRDDASIAYGMANGAIHIPQEGVVDRLTSEPELLKGRTAILYCARGILSMELASELNRRGIPSRSLTGGYNGWLLAHLAGDTPDKSEAEKEEARLARQKRIEDSIRRKFHVPLFSRFAKAVRDYELIQENDKIAVCISGGKDSMLLALLLQDLQHTVDFDLVFLAMDPGYAPEGRKHLEENAKRLDIPLEIFNTDVLRVAGVHSAEHPCFLCAKMRRGYLYTEARRRGCNKIALGHHYDDAIGTVLMGLIYGGQVQAMLPRVKAKNYEGMELIRPLYFTREQSVIDWAEYCGLTFLPCDCPAKKLESDTKRAEIKQLIASLAANNPQIEANIFNAVKNVDTAKLLGWRDANGKHNFLDQFE